MLRNLLWVVLAYPMSVCAQEKIPATSPDITYTCQDALQKFSSVQDATASPEEMIAITASINKCAATSYNNKQRNLGNDDVALPSATVEDIDGKKIVVFELIKMNKKDLNSVRTVCTAAASASGVILGDGDPLLTPVLSKGGEYSCNSYIDAAIANNGMLFVAPTLLPGIDMTKDVLKLAGIPEKTIKKAEEAITSTAGTVGQSTVTVVTGGAVSIDKKFKCVKVFGKRVCR